MYKILITWYCYYLHNYNHGVFLIQLLIFGMHVLMWIATFRSHQPWPSCDLHSLTLDDLGQGYGFSRTHFVQYMNIKWLKDYEFTNVRKLVIVCFTTSPWVAGPECKWRTMADGPLHFRHEPFFFHHWRANMSEVIDWSPSWNGHILETAE